MTRIFSFGCSAIAAVALSFASIGCSSADSTFSDPGDGDDDTDQEEAMGKADGPGAGASAAARNMHTPDLTDEQEQEVLARYTDIDPDNLVPQALLEKALVYYDFNKDDLPNQKFINIVDFSKHSSKKRMYLIDMNSGAVERHVVAHGSGSDPDNDGLAQQFGNVPNSNRSSLGFYLTAETYNGKHGYSLRLDGLSDTNSNVRARAIVIHGASYVENGRSKQGRSWGCPAVPMGEKDSLINRVKGGSILYTGLSGVR